MSIEPIALSVADAAPATAGIASALPELSAALSQSNSPALQQMDLTEKPLASSLAENAHLTKALDQALSDVRQLVAVTEITSVGESSVSVAETSDVVAETPVAAVAVPVSADVSVSVDATPSSRQDVMSPIEIDAARAPRPQAVESPVAVITEADDGRARSPSAPTDMPTPVGRDVPIAPQSLDNVERVETPIAARSESAPYQAETPVVAEQSVVIGQQVVAAATPNVVETPGVTATPVVVESPDVAAVSDDGRARSPSAPQAQDNVERVEMPIAARPESAPYQVVDTSDTEFEAPVAAPTPTADAIVAAGIVPAAEIAVAAQRTVEPSAVAAPSASAASPGSASVMPSQALVETASAVADALIVTPGLMRGEGVVSVQLKSDVLDGAQVTIAVNGRQMEVAFASGSAEVAALIERNLPQIQQYLGARIHSFTIGVKLNRTRS